MSTAEDTVLSFTAAQFEGVYTDGDGDSLAAVKVMTLPDAEHGALALDGNAVTAEQEIEHADLGDLTFTPAANFVNGSGDVRLQGGGAVGHGNGVGGCDGDDHGDGGEGDAPVAKSAWR